MTINNKILFLRRNTGLYGADNVILVLARHLSKMGFSPVIGVINDNRHPCTMLLDEATVLGLKTVQFESNSRLDINTIKNISTYIATNKIALVHTHGFKADIYGFLARFKQGVPIVATKHGWTHGNRIIRVWEKIDLYFLKYFNTIVAVSDKIYETLLKKGINKNKIKIILNGVNIEQKHVDPIELIDSLKLRNKKVVGIVGRLSIEKGHAILIDAAKDVILQVPDVRFLIIGDGPLRQELENQVNVNGLEQHIIFTGFRSDVPELYKVIHILVSCSLREGMPMNILEAMAAQKAIIATKVGGVPRLIQDGKTGRLIEANQIDELAQTLIELLNNTEEQKRLGKAALESVIANFSGESMAANYAKVYKQNIQSS